MRKKKIRVLALAVIANSRGELLLHQAYDHKKKQTFYRPLGGGIKFGETSRQAVVRELFEELSAKVTVTRDLGVVESIFVYEGQNGHEVVVLLEARFKKRSLYYQKEFEIVESGKAVGKAVWRSPTQIRSEKAKLYPVGLETLI